MFDTQPNYESRIDDIRTDLFKLSYLPLTINGETLLENGIESLKSLLLFSDELSWILFILKKNPTDKYSSLTTPRIKD